MKSKKALFIIIPVCIAFVAAIVLLVLFATGAFLSPKARVMLALSRTFGAGSVISEYSGNTGVSQYGYAPEYLADLLAISDTFTSMKERGYSFDSSITLSDISAKGNEYMTAVSGYDSLAGAGLNLAGEVDTVNRIAYYDLGIKYSFFKFSLGQYYISDSSISMAMPSYFEGYLTLPTDTLGSSYNASVFPSVLGLGKIPQELEDAVSFSAFDLFCPSVSDKDALADSDEMLSALKDFYDDIEVEKTGETRSIFIGKKQQDCSEYLITIDENAVLSLMDAYEDWYFKTNEETFEKYDAFYAYFASTDPEDFDPSSSFSDMVEDVFDAYKEIFAIDHEIYVYLDSKDRLAAASYENELDTGSIYSLQDNDAISAAEEASDLINDYFDGDLSIIDFGDGNLNSFYDDDDNDDDDNDDSAYVRSEPCSIFAEIVFHGGDYLPERYEGSLMFAFDDGSSCEISFTGDNKSDAKEIYYSNLYATINLTDSGTTTRYDTTYSVSYEPKDHYLQAELTATDEANVEVLNITLDSTAAVEDDTINLELEELSLTNASESGEFSISFTAEASISPLSDRVPLPEGREHNLLIMTDSDYDQLFEEILGFLW